MGTGRTNEFRKDTVRIALTSGLLWRQIAHDQGVDLSTLNKWVNAHRHMDVASSRDRGVVRLALRHASRAKSVLADPETRQPTM